MALQILQQPGSLSFASDPIIVKAKTTLTGKTFLRIKLTCTVTVYRSSDGNTYTEEYSFNVSSDGVATFNVSGTVETALSYSIRQEAQGTSIVQEPYAARYVLAFKEVYIEDRVEKEGDSLTSEGYNAIPGSLTEYERMTAPHQDVAMLLGGGKILSRKPEGEIIPKGTTLFLPAVNTQSGNIPYTLVQDSVENSYSTNAGGAFVPTTVRIGTNQLSIGELVVKAVGDTAGKKYVIQSTPYMRNFVFINGFGLMESVTAVTRESFSYDIQSEQYTVSKEIGFRPTTQVLSYSDSPMASIAMSSGYVSRQWAEWWINEFCVTKKAWLVDGEHPLPVAIIPEETVELYDRSKPSLVAVNFTVRYSFTGGTYNSFV